MKQVLKMSAISTALLTLPMMANADVLASVKPLGFITSSIANGVTDTQILVPAGASPHDYSLKLSDVQKVKSADLVLWVGEDIDAFLSRQLNNSLEKLSPLTIDEGIFCFLDTTSFISTSNSARTKRNLIKQSRKRDSNESTYFLSKMISWQVLHLFKLFHDSLEFSKVLGLGCFINETCTEIHLLKQKEFTTDQRDIVFNQIIRSKKKNNKIDLNKIIINQLNDLDSELF